MYEWGLVMNEVWSGEELLTKFIVGQLLHGANGELHLNCLGFRLGVTGANVFRLQHYYEVALSAEIVSLLNILAAVYKTQAGDTRELHEPGCCNTLNNLMLASRSKKALFDQLEQAKINMLKYWDNKSANWSCGQNFLKNIGSCIAIIIGLDIRYNNPSRI